MGFHRIKTCEGRNPKSEEPCDDCPYLEKFGCEPEDLSVEDKDGDFYDGKCSFMVKVGYSGKQGYKQRVHDVEITDKGKKALLKDYVTPKMVKEAKWKTEQRTRENNDGLLIINPKVFDNLFNEILEEKAKKVFEQTPSGEL